MKTDPIRGEVWLADLGMAGKIRPVLVVSAALAPDDFALVMIIPRTTSIHPSRFSVPMNLPGMKEGSFNLQGMLSLPLSKFMRRLTVLRNDQMDQINEALKKWLCLE